MIKNNVYNSVQSHTHKNITSIHLNNGNVQTVFLDYEIIPIIKAVKYNPRSAV